MFGAQTVLPAMDSPLRRRPPPNGATIGEMQPGDWISGSEIGWRLPNDRSAGQEVSCDPA